MLVSLKLLKEVIPFEYTAEELAGELTLLGLEVEEIVRKKHDFENVVTARVEELVKIPDTKLFKLFANTGSDRLQIVTAASNLKDGDIVPLALPQSRIAGSVRIEPRTFKKANITSYGMLCSYKELGIDADILSSEEKEGIFIFPDDTPVGMTVEEVLPIDDEFIDLSLLPDRADAFYLIGVARWIEILKARKENRKADFSRFHIDTGVELVGETDFPVVVDEPALAPFYSGRLIRNVNIQKSSLSLRKKLFMLRSRPINNVVDITNFVLKFYGQPLHAFDFDKIQEEIRVRSAKDGEKIRTLDGVERTLSKWNLLIADKSGPIALAGVMGGEETEVSKSTKNVFLESAYFSPACISKSARSLKLITDASMLFEKGTDPLFPEKASLFASKLIAKEANGVPAKSNIFDAVKKPEPVFVRFERINKLLGKNVSKDEIKKCFDYEGFDYEVSQTGLKVFAPSFRRDINIEVDLIEEVLRIKGYNSFGEELLTGKLKSAIRTPEEEFLWNVRNILTLLGLTEVLTVSLTSRDVIEKSGIATDNIGEVINPFSEDIKVLRPSLFPLLMEVAELNKKRGVKDIAIFETGNVFHFNGKTYDEKPMLGILVSGDRIALNPFKKTLPYDFYYLKGVLESFSNRVGVNIDFNSGKVQFLHPYQTAIISANNQNIGFVGAVSTDVAKKFGIKDPLFYAEINIPLLMSFSKKEKMYNPIPQLPPLKMDVAIVVDKDIPEKRVRSVIEKTAPYELQNIELFDIYMGEPLAENEKNLAYSLYFYSSEHTMKREEIESFIEKLEENVKRELNGKLRKE
jgi:phenylalanyl-tRNA synthetase beta chain